MNEQQLQLIKDSTIEEIKDCLDWANEVMDSWESLLTLFDESVLGQILGELPSSKNMIEQMTEFRLRRDEVAQAYEMKKDLCHAR